MIPDGPEDLLYALGVAGEIRALLPDAVVESDLTARGIVKGLGRAGQLAKDPSKHAFRIGRVHAVLLGSAESGEEPRDPQGSLDAERRNRFRAVSSPSAWPGGSDDPRAATGRDAFARPTRDGRSSSRAGSRAAAISAS